jgi:heme exporter protein D
MSVLEFFAMKGYAWYIWGSYGVAILLIIVEIMLVRHKRTITLQQLRLVRDAENED